MRESLDLLWYRFKYLIVALAVTLAALGGGLLGARSDKTETTRTTKGSVTVLLRGETGVQDCVENHYPGRDRDRCLEELQAVGALPVSTLDDGFTLGAFAAEKPYSAPWQAQTEGVAEIRPVDLSVDLDNDTRPERVSVIARAQGSTLSIESVGPDGRAAETLTRRTDLQEAGNVRGVVAGDLNADGWQDLVLHSAPGSRNGVVTVLLNSGFKRPGELAASEAAQRRVQEALDAMYAGAAPELPREIRSVNVTDIDFDGTSDLLLLGPYGTMALVRGGQEPGPALVLPAPLGSQAVAVADVNRDGKQDILVASSISSIPSGVRGLCPYNRPCDLSGGIGQGGVAMLLADEQGWTISTELSIADVWGVTGLAVLDIESDGWVDLAITRENTQDEEDTLGGLELHHAVAPDGILTGFESRTGPDLVNLGPVSAVSVLDADRDGDQDILFGGRGRDRVWLWTNEEPQQRWLEVRAAGSGRYDRAGSHYSGFGVVVEIVDGPRVTRVAVGSGASGTQYPTVRVGLGAGSSELTEVNVLFPVRKQNVKTPGVKTGETLTVTEPQN